MESQSLISDPRYPENVYSWNASQNHDTSFQAIEKHSIPENSLLAESTDAVDVSQQIPGKRSRNVSIDQSVSMQSVSEAEIEEEELHLLDIPDLPKAFGTNGKTG